MFFFFVFFDVLGFFRGFKVRVLWFRAIAGVLEGPVRVLQGFLQVLG